MRVLIDRDFERNAIICQTKEVDKAIQWGNQQYIVQVLQRVDKTPRLDEQFRIKNLPFLASLCRAAKEGMVEFYSSPELMMERARQKGPDDGYLGFNLLEGVSKNQCKSPVQRTISFGEFGNSHGTTKEEQLDFFTGINNPRFLEIRKHIPESHIGGAFHLWTAELNNLDVFLTMDKKFYRNANQKRKLISNRTFVETPESLCKKLDLAKTDLEILKAEIDTFL